MDLPAQRWQKAITVRHSSRTYNNQPLSAAEQEKMVQFIEYANSGVEGVRAVLVKNGGNLVIQSIIGSYGLIKGVRSYLAFIIDRDDKYNLEKIGYLGEMCVLEATAMGLDTCWISGTFKPQLVAEQLSLKPVEQVVAITPVGHSKQKKSIMERLTKKVTGSSKRKELTELCPAGYNPKWPEWIRDALESARVAPSAINNQPWRFIVSEDNKRIEIIVDGNKNLVRKRLDCGIVMLHLEVAALNHGIRGEWSYLEKPGIAAYAVK